MTTRRERKTTTPPERKVPLPGDLVRDRVTRLEGVVIARTQHLNMCDRYTVQPQIKEAKAGVEEKLPTAYIIDVNDLIVVEENAIGLSDEERHRWTLAILPPEEMHMTATGGCTSPSQSREPIRHEPAKRV